MPRVQLTLKAPRPRVLAGEGVVLDLDVATTEALAMERVELNRGRTRLRIAPEVGPEEVLTGDDHAGRFGVGPEQAVGKSFKAPAGSAWSVKLELLAYRAALPPGRYRISVEYLVEPGKDEVATAGPVEVEVVPATTHGFAPRWLGGSLPRAKLGAMRVAGADGAAPRLFYHLCAQPDPAAERIAVDVGEAPQGELPRLAHVNGIPEARVERWAAWVDATHVRWVCFDQRGPRARGGLEHGLSPARPPALVDPPLHCADGRLVAAAIGVEDGKPALVLVEVTPAGEAKRRQVRLVGEPAEQAAIVWTSEAPPGGLLLRTVPGAEGTRLVRDPFPDGRPIDHAELGWTADAVLALALDQWRGDGAVTLVTSAPGPKDGEHTLRVAAWAARGAEPVAERTRVVEGPFDLAEAQPVVGGRDAALLARVPDGWRVLAPAGAATVPLLAEGEPRPPRLVVGGEPGGHHHGPAGLPVWLVRWTRAGAVVTRAEVGP